MTEPQTRTLSTTDQNKTITVLSIDGGGVRGIIPAVILQALEKELQVRCIFLSYQIHYLKRERLGA